MIENMLLETGVIERNKYFEKYVEIVSKPDQEGYVEKHHILPVSYFRLRNLDVDNSPYNIVTLSAYNHILAHYYLYRCITDPEWKNKLALAFQFMKRGQQGHLLTLTESEFISLLPEYAKLSEYNYWKGRRRSTQSIQKSIQTRMINKEEIYAKIAAKNRGRKRNEETRKLMSISQKNRDPETFARGYKLSEEQKQHLRSLNLGKKQSEYTKQKRSESLHKLEWFTDGSMDVRAQNCPVGFWKGRSYKMTDETKAKCVQTGKKWFNNGIKNTMAFQCPEGYVKGKLHNMSKSI